MKQDTPAQARVRSLRFVRSEIRGNLDATESKRQAHENAGHTEAEQFHAGQAKAYSDIVTRLDSLIELAETVY